MDQVVAKIYNQALQDYEKGLIKESIEGLKKVVAAYPDYPDVHNALGLAYSLAGNFKAAIESFKRATELNPEYIEAYVNMAIIFNEQCQFEEAIKSFQKAAELETKEKGFSPQLKAKLANTYMQLGDTYYELQEYKKAKEEYLRAIDVSPGFLDIKLKLAKTYNQLGEFADAEHILKDILARNKKYLEARVLLGLVFYQQHKFDEARREWEEVTKIDPMNIKAKAYLNMLKERK
ncbi:MAG: tetratricopeptide repeat protein [candidate division WOR-3 bacterium]